MSLVNIESDLVAYWPLEELSGTRFDFTDFDNDLSDNNTVGSAVAIIGSGAHFIRSNSEYLLDSTSSGVLDFGDEDFTIAFWASLDTKPGSAQTMVSKFRAGTNRQYFVDFAPGSDRFRFLVDSDGTAGTTIVFADNFGSPTANTLVFIVAWHDSVANTINIQVNDGAVNSTAHTGGAFQGSALFSLGSYQDSGGSPIEFFNGILDEVAVWNRVLGSAEKTSLYNGGNGVNLQSVLTPIPTSGFFGGFMQVQEVFSVSGFFGGFLQSVEETFTASFGGLLFAQATSEAKNSGFFGGFMRAEVPVVISGSFGGYMESFITGPSGNFGGLLFAKASNIDQNVAIFGGFMQGQAFQEVSGRFGGFVQAQPQTPVPPAFIGGIVSGLESQSAQFGGWMFGAPGADDFTEQHSRTLVKVRSEDVVDQGLDLDSQIILFQRANADFRGKLRIESTSNSQFHGKLEITRDKTIPTTFATVNKFTDASGIIEVTVEASGIPGEPDSFFANAQIDFGDPYDVEFGVEGQILRGGVALPTVSGSISGFEFDQLNPGPSISGFSKTIRASHIYRDPGRYIITTKFTDNLGIVHMQGFECDLLTTATIASVSGVPIKGIDYPAIEISGIPREGSVPESLRIDYTLRASGTGFAVLEGEVAKLNNTNVSSNDFINWSFGNGFTATIKRPFAYYDAPGLYIPVLRYQFNHPSGIQTGMDGSGVPVFGTRSIWLSESLLIGFNI